MITGLILSPVGCWYCTEKDTYFVHRILKHLDMTWPLPLHFIQRRCSSNSALHADLWWRSVLKGHANLPWCPPHSVTIFSLINHSKMLLYDMFVINYLNLELFINPSCAQPTREWFHRRLYSFKVFFEDTIFHSCWYKQWGTTLPQNEPTK